MKKIFLSITAVMMMTAFTAFADTGKKAASKKATKTETCKKSNCPKAKECKKTTCAQMPGCVCH